eukprot:2371893-Lingulodinium_polyedra.AAC.1
MASGRALWGAGGAKRVFAIRVGDQWRLAYVNGANAQDAITQKIYDDIDKDINFIRGLALHREI